MQAGRRILQTPALLVAAAVYLGACANFGVRPAVPPAPPPAPPAGVHRELRVTATAFNSHVDQTDGQPTLTASGERLRPGMRAIAVSPDLERAGLEFGTRVQIEGLDGEWIVLDRMPPKWRRKIDVYMGEDEAAARRFGERTLRIRWRPR